MRKCPKCGSEDVEFYWYKDDYAVASCCNCKYEERKIIKSAYEYFPHWYADDDETEQ